MTIEQIKKVLTSLSQAIEDNEKTPIALLSVKLARAQEQYPEDRCIGQVSDIVSRMNNSNKLFITRAEIKDLYKKLYSRNTKFAEVFADELGIKVASLPEKTASTHKNDGTLLIKEAYEKVVDPVLADQLNLAFGGPSFSESSLQAKTVESKIKMYLDKTGLKPESIKLAGRTNNVLLFSVGFITPKGTTNIFIPYHTQKQADNLFISNAGVMELTKDNLLNYLLTNSGVKLAHSAQDVLKAVSSSLVDKSEVSDVDLAVIKMKAAKGTDVEFAAPQVLYQKIEENKVKDIELPKYHDEKIETFAKSFDTPAGVAEFKFGKDAVKRAHYNVLRKLNDFGLYNAQLSIAASDDKGISYAVSANDGKIAFKVPVKIDGKNVYSPEVFISNGSVNALNQKNILEILASNKVDHKALAVASPLYALKPGDLIQTVEQAVSESNFKKAEDALNVLYQLEDKKAYDNAFKIYAHGLSGVEKPQASKCTMIIRNANNSSPVCGHTNLPLNKVYQDKHGNCLPLYRKEMEQTGIGAYFMNSKIFF